MTTSPVFPLALANNMGTLPYLPLGMVVAHLRVYGQGKLNDQYDLRRLQPGGMKEFPLEFIYAELAQHAAPICLLSSYVWNHELNLEAAARIRRDTPHALIIFGGPEVPKYPGDTEAFLAEHSFVDIAVLGEGEAACAEILEVLAGRGRAALAELKDIAGLVVRSDETSFRTAERNRISHVNALPSPYLTGEFEPWFHDLPTTILETNRGCPYGCTYCDWGSATLQKVTRFEPQRVIAEVEYMAQSRARSIFIADANFGMLEQDIAIAEAIVSARQRLGYPQRLYTNFAKNGGRRLMQVIKILHEGGLLPNGIIALQTTDVEVLKAIKRDNIRTTSYEKMMTWFNAEGIPMSSDLMIGLPGQTVDSLQADLQFCFDWKVSAHGNYTSMMPNAPMNEASYRAEHMIVTDGDGMVASTSSFSAEDMAYMKSLYMVYQFHVRLGVLKYLLYYLQLEHGIPAMDLLRRWLDAVLSGDTQLPLSQRLYKEVFAMERRAGDWALMSWGQEAGRFFQVLEGFYDEMRSFVARNFDTYLSEPIFTAIRTAQLAVMPQLGRHYPYRVSMPHDLTAFFEQVRSEASLHQLQDKLQPLESFPAGELTVEPERETFEHLGFIKMDAHSDDWELPSALRFY